MRIIDLMETLRHLDERVLPSREGERARTVRFVPWMAFAALILQFVAIATGFDFLDGMVVVFLAGVAVGSLQMSRWLREP